MDAAYFTLTSPTGLCVTLRREFHLHVPWFLAEIRLCCSQNGVKMQAAQALLAISFIKPCRPLVALLLVQIWGYSLTWDNGLGSGWRHLDYWHGKDDLEHFLEGVQMLSGNDASDEMTSEGLIIQASPS